MIRPLAIDLYAGLGGWAEGLIAEDFDVIGFDTERHVYGEMASALIAKIPLPLSRHIGATFRPIHAAAG